MAEVPIVQKRETHMHDLELDVMSQPTPDVISDSLLYRCVNDYKNI